MESSAKLISRVPAVASLAERAVLPFRPTPIFRKLCLVCAQLRMRQRHCQCIVTVDCPAVRRDQCVSLNPPSLPLSAECSKIARHKGCRGKWHATSARLPAVRGGKAHSADLCQRLRFES
jgi:hypothetical protein